MILILFVVFARCPAMDHPAAEKTILKLAYIGASLSGVDSKDAHVALQLWADQLTSAIAEEVQIVSEIYPDAKAVENGIQQSKLDMVALPPMVYIDLKQKFHFTPTAVLGTKVGEGEKYALIVHKNSGIKSLADLSGKVINIQSHGQIYEVSELWLEEQLLENNLGRVDKFFLKIDRKLTASKCSLPVFFNQVESCLVNKQSFDTLKELNPQLGDQLMVIAESPVFLKAVLCYTEKCEMQYRKLLDNLLPNLHTYTKGRQIMMLFKFDRLIPFQKQYLNSIIDLRNSLQALKH